YIRASTPLDTKKLKELLEATPDPKVITGDLNAHNVAWGSPDKNYRGEHLFEILDEAGMVILNDGRPTFALPGKVSHLHVTAVSQDLASFASWDVSPNQWGSDHFPTFTTIRGPKKTKKKQMKLTDWVQFRKDTTEKLKSDCSDISSFSKLITESQENCTSSLRTHSQKVDMELSRLQAIRNNKEK